MNLGFTYFNFKINSSSYLKNGRFIYIIIWLSPYILFVRSLSPPKLAGLARRCPFSKFFEIFRTYFFEKKKIIIIS
jgi:hypothetical protein